MVTFFAFVSGLVIGVLAALRMKMFWADRELASLLSESTRLRDELRNLKLEANDVRPRRAGEGEGGVVKLNDLVYDGSAYIVAKGNEVFLTGDCLVALHDQSIVLYDEHGEESFFSMEDFQLFPDEGWDVVELELRPTVPWNTEEEYLRLLALSDCLYDLLTGLSHRGDSQKEPSLYAEMTVALRCYEDYRSEVALRRF